VCVLASFLCASAVNVPAASAKPRAASYPAPPWAICIETRGSRATIGDLNALKSCKDKPGSIPVTF
jgi:hypothetical protein